MIMKNSMKKLISLAAFAFSVFCLSACNGNTNNTDPGNTNLYDFNKLIMCWTDTITVIKLSALRTENLLLRKSDHTDAMIL